MQLAMLSPVGQYKSCTLDSMLDRGLDSGLNIGLNVWTRILITKGQRSNQNNQEKF